MAKAGVYISVIGGSDVAVKSIAAARKELEKLESQSKSASVGLSKGWTDAADKMSAAGNKLTLGLTLPVAAGFAFMLREQNEAIKVGRQTEAVLESTGHAAGLQARDVDRLATSISKKTAIDDEQIQSAENMLLTFTGVRNELGAGNDIFDRATRTIVDMSVAMGTDMNTSAIQLGKALNDPVAGITALTRVGVTFTDQQKEQIRTLVESGQKLEAQKIILAELGKEFGGSAAAAATPLDRLKVSLANTAEELGGRVMPLTERFAGVVIHLADAFLAMPDWAQDMVLGTLAVSAAAGPVLKLSSGVISLANGVLTMASNMSSGTGAASKFASTLGSLGPQGAIVAGVVVGAALIGKAIADAGELTFDADAAVRQLGRTTDEQLGRKFIETAQVLKAGGKDIEEAFRDVAQASVGTAERLIPQLQSMGYETDAFERILRKEIAAQNQANTDSERGAKVLRDQAGATGEVTTSTDIAAEAVDDFRQKLDELLGASITVEQANIRYQDSIDEVRQSLIDNGATLDLYTEAGRRNREEITGATTDVYRLAEAMVRQQGDTEGATQLLYGHVEGLRTTMTQAGLTEAEINDYLTTLGLTPAQITTLVEALNTDVATSKVDDVKAAVDQVPDNKTVWFDANTTSISARLGELASRFFFDDGGYVDAPQGRAVPATVHGGEYVLSADIVDRIVRRRPSRGADTDVALAPTFAAAAPSSSPGGPAEIHKHYHLSINGATLQPLDEERIVELLEHMEMMDAAHG